MKITIHDTLSVEDIVPTKKVLNPNDVTFLYEGNNGIDVLRTPYSDSIFFEDHFSGEALTADLLLDESFMCYLQQYDVDLGFELEKDPTSCDIVRATSSDVTSWHEGSGHCITSVEEIQQVVALLRKRATMPHPEQFIVVWVTRYDLFRTLHREYKLVKVEPKNKTV